MDLGKLVDRVKGVTPIKQVVAVQGRFGADGAGLLGSAIAFQAFISLFPLILLGLSVIGFVLESRPDMQADWQRAIGESIPGLAQLVGDNFDAIVDARAGTGIIGLLGLAWRGTALVRVSRAAVHRVLHRDDPSNPATGVLRAFRTFLLMGLLSLVTLGVGVWAGNAPATGATGLALRGAATAVSIAVDIGFFTVAYWLLSQPHGPPPRRLIPGAILAAVVWTILKLVGSWFARRTVGDAIAIYGTFAASIGLLVILALAARGFMYGIVINALRQERPAGVLASSDGKASARAS